MFIDWPTEQCRQALPNRRQEKSERVPNIILNTFKLLSLYNVYTIYTYIKLDIYSSFIFKSFIQSFLNAQK